MMKKLFKNIDLFCPGTNEFIFDFIYGLGYSDKDLQRLEDRNKIKKEVLLVIKFLLEIDVIKVKTWLNKTESKEVNDFVNQSIEEINKVWFVNASYPDFYNMVLFGPSDWYYDALKNIGFTETTDWKVFVREKIGDLENWIEEKRPTK